MSAPPQRGHWTRIIAILNLSKSREISVIM
jgi:hypothetical protein